MVVFLFFTDSSFFVVHPHQDYSFYLWISLDSTLGPRDAQYISFLTLCDSKHFIVPILPVHSPERPSKYVMSFFFFLGRVGWIIMRLLCLHARPSLTARRIFDFEGAINIIDSFSSIGSSLRRKKEKEIASSGSEGDTSFETVMYKTAWGSRGDFELPL